MTEKMHVSGSLIQMPGLIAFNNFAPSQCWSTEERLGPECLRTRWWTPPPSRSARSKGRAATATRPTSPRLTSTTTGTHPASCHSCVPNSPKYTPLPPKAPRSARVIYTTLSHRLFVSHKKHYRESRFFFGLLNQQKYSTALTQWHGNQRDKWRRAWYALSKFSNEIFITIQNKIATIINPVLNQSTWFWNFYFYEHMYQTNFWNLWTFGIKSLRSLRIFKRMI